MSDIASRIISHYQHVTSRLPEKKGSLRFDRCSVSVSAIAQQYYCEKALELSFMKPVPRTQKMKDGEAGHENVSVSAHPITREEAIHEAALPRKAAVCIYEFSVAWEHNGVILVGNVDEAWFREASVELVTERKFSGSLKIYQPYHVQAGLYCLGLGEMGFDNASAHYRLELLKHSCFNCPELTLQTCPTIAGKAPDHRCTDGESAAYVFGFSKEQTVADLDWALDYWLGKREAVPAGNPAKCRPCRYRDVCAERSG